MLLLGVVWLPSALTRVQLVEEMVMVVGPHHSSWACLKATCNNTSSRRSSAPRASCRCRSLRPTLIAGPFFGTWKTSIPLFPRRHLATLRLELARHLQVLEIALADRRGPPGTAAGEVAFPKGKEIMQSVIKRLRRRLGYGHGSIPGYG
ncbi:hypothetical protein DUNSADRAFT_7133 [Dunaliella salina]|uniref:Encoded protein n=1 Tax=Dunaliella salina TaxID=3046 RepID=A0ABQ7GLZ3_DUNSA|nr:hypothetical protein DUNSADRAFT_7133 [Dunaliella salina]|eukprot:KAF5835631.1 hypothetical protein DUNSADRAFT_7133 [Dunaliella salina]